MEIVTNLDDLTNSPPSSVTVGTFDGLHKGHQRIIENITERAARNAFLTTVVTFEPHPQIVLHNRDVEIRLLSTLEEKLSMFEEFGVDRVVVVPFTKEFAATEYQDFIEFFLLKKINMKCLVLGYDAALGKGRKGHLEEIKHHAMKHDYILEIVPPYEVNDIIVNSTLVRKKLAGGKVSDAAHYLGRPYAIRGTVEKGDGRGTGLGFPTANIIPESRLKLIPKQGVYAVRVQIEDMSLKGMMNIGVRPTFKDESDLSMEVHVFNYSGNLYDKQVAVNFVDFIREEMKFENSQRLTEQLKLDEQEAKKILDGGLK